MSSRTSRSRTKNIVRLWRSSALVGAPVDGIFPVQFLVSRESDDEVMRRVVADTVRELDHYLIELGEPDAWAYAIYHCGTAANLYSRVHWSYADSKET